MNVHESVLEDSVRFAVELDRAIDRYRAWIGTADTVLAAVPVRAVAERSFEIDVPSADVETCRRSADCSVWWQAVRFEEVAMEQGVRVDRSLDAHLALTSR